ncbi:MAG: serine/threonine protein kinase, partial [Deltaproteobacteria bacterium]|nr:serine/threonine protein kinase [Deltaproteobacteria bacterium]
MSGAVPAHLVGDRWRAVRLIARGGMGAVYEAQHHLTGERAALKIVFAHTAFDPIAAERFVREVSLGSEIGHAGIVRVLDAGADPRTGALYLAMELLEGETLAARMNRAYDPWGATRAIADVLDPLAAAHAKGVVHRDLKPQNVFLARRPGGGERVVLVDLGLARQMGDAGTTSTQAIVGSPGYIAPEQATSARAATPAADVWAAGVMLYEAWATVQPFRGETPAAMIVATCTTTPAPLAT